MPDRLPAGNEGHDEGTPRYPGGLNQDPYPRYWPWLMAAIFTALAIPYLLALRLPEVGTYHDDGIYAVTAKALAEGDGYRLMSLPGEPPQTKYPPLFPFVLSLVWRMFPDFPGNLPWLKLVPLACTVWWFVLSFRLLRVLGASRAIAAGVTAALAASPTALKFSTALLSETAFAALATASLLCLARAEAGEPLTRRRVVVAACLAALATLTRVVGIALPVAALGWLLSRRQWRHALLFSTVVGAMLAPWLWWIAANNTSGYYAAGVYSSWSILSGDLGAGFREKVFVIVRNALQIISAPAVYLSSAAVLLPLLAPLTGFLLVKGAIRALKKNLPMLWFAGMYLGLVVCWPWPPYRFAIVFLPVLFALMLQSLPRRIVGLRGLWPLVCLLALAAPAALNSYHRIHLAEGTGMLYWTDLGEENWRDMLETAAWIRDHTDPSTVVVGNLDPLYYLLTGRTAVRGFEPNPYPLYYAAAPETPPLRIALAPGGKAEGRPFVVVQSPDSIFGEREYLHERIGKHERDGKLQTVFRSGGFRILRPAEGVRGELND